MLRKFFSYLIILLVFASCGISEKQIEERAATIAQTLDTNEVKIFYEWNFSSRGERGFWFKNNDSTINYTCQYFIEKDTSYIWVFEPYKFASDFPNTFKYDTVKYSDFTFSKFRNKISISGNRHGTNNIIKRNISSDSLFKKTDPFSLLNHLTNLKDSLKITHIYSNLSIGNFIEFYLGYQHVLTYLPDNLFLNEYSKKTWEVEFKKGKVIKKNWNFRKLDRPLDNG